MAKKKTNQQEKKVQVKKKVQKRKKNTRRHVKGEIISWEELENRTGLTGDETELLTVYLHKFERGEVHVRCSKKLKDLETAKRFAKLSQIDLNSFQSR